MYIIKTIIVVALCVAAALGFSSDRVDKLSLDGLELEVVEFSGKSLNYLFLKSLISVEQAVVLCGRYYGRLVSVEDQFKDLEMIDSVGGEMANHAWTAGRRNASCDEFTWTTTGKPIGNYNHWAVGQPGELVGCIYYARTGIEGLTWHVGDCNARKAAICEIQAKA